MQDGRVAPSWFPATRIIWMGDMQIHESELAGLSGQWLGLSSSAPKEVAGHIIAWLTDCVDKCNDRELEVGKC